jgi:hypothetical protein
MGIQWICLLKILNVLSIIPREKQLWNIQFHTLFLSNTLKLFSCQIFRLWERMIKVISEKHTNCDIYVLTTHTILALQIDLGQFVKSVKNTGDDDSEDNGYIIN